MTKWRNEMAAALPGARERSAERRAEVQAREIATAFRDLVPCEDWRLRAARNAVAALSLPSVEIRREALLGATDVSSGPDGRGTMRVVVSGFPPGKEARLFGLLSEALSPSNEEERL